MTTADRLVLIVDDQPDVRLMVSYQLASCGGEIAEAGDGPEALGFVARRPPAVIVLDYQMPGMLGTEVAEELQASGYGGTILLYSAHLTHELRTRAAELGLVAVNKTELDELRRPAAVRGESLGVAAPVCTRFP